MTGELGRELSIVINNIGLGADLAAELSEAASRIGHEGFHELVEKLNMSLDRGAPVAEQTMQLAYSLRQEQGRALLRQAGSSGPVGDGSWSDPADRGAFQPGAPHSGL